MVKFNELRISSDKTCLIVDAQVESLEAYKGVYIDSIYIDSYENYQTSGPSQKAVFAYSASDSSAVVNGDEEKTRVHISIPVASFNKGTFEGGLFYVYVVCEGLSTAAASLDCGMDSNVDIGIILDWEKVYREGMQLIKRLAGKCFDKCSDNDALMDFILRWQALMLAIKTCDYDMINDMWITLFGYEAAHDHSVHGGCGCRGMRRIY